MTTPTQESVKALADGLTKAEKEALLGDRFSSTETWWSLHRRGLVSKPGSNTGVGYYPVTFAVIAHLGASHGKARRWR